MSGSNTSDPSPAACCSDELATRSDTGVGLVDATDRGDDRLGREILLYLRTLLGDRRVLIGLAAVVIVAGAVLNWGWLVAVGAAPILLSLAPCAAMCALGVCAMCKGGGKSCDNSGGPQQASKQAAPTTTDQERRRGPEAKGQ